MYIYSLELNIVHIVYINISLNYRKKINTLYTTIPVYSSKLAPSSKHIYVGIYIY